MGGMSGGGGGSGGGSMPMPTIAMPNPTPWPPTDFFKPTWPQTDPNQPNPNPNFPSFGSTGQNQFYNTILGGT